MVTRIVRRKLVQEDTAASGLSAEVTLRQFSTVRANGFSTINACPPPAADARFPTGILLGRHIYRGQRRIQEELAGFACCVLDAKFVLERSCLLLEHITKRHHVEPIDPLQSLRDLSETSAPIIPALRHCITYLHVIGTHQASFM